MTVTVTVSVTGKEKRKKGKKEKEKREKIKMKMKKALLSNGRDRVDSHISMAIDRRKVMQAMQAI